MSFFTRTTNYRISLTLLILIVFSSQSLIAQLPAFPSAYGAGAYTSGGRGGVVVHVTNLNDSGPGSLREALLLRATRTIVFDVSGVISLKSMLYVGGNGNFTIAGQTAPKGGITLDGEKVYFSSLDNIIVRHIRIKGGIDADLIPHSGDKKGNSSLSVVGNMTNQIWDHVSFAFGEDETAEWYDTGNHDLDKVTIQKCFIAEGRKGGIFGKLTGRTGLSGNLSYINNLFYNAGYRFPNVSGDGIKIDLINNAAWTTTGRLVRGSGSYNLNHIGNYYDYGNYPIYDKTIHLHSEGTVPKIYTANNKIIAPNVSRNKLTSTVAEMNADNNLSWKHFVGNKYGVQLPSTYFTNVQRPLNGRVFPIVDAETAFENAVNDIGCNARLNADGGVSDNKDVLDAEWISQIEQGNYIPKLSESKYIVPHILSVSRPSNFYISNPHIPEVWFQINVPKGQDHNDIAPSGYTWLEEYLNQVDRSNETIEVDDVEVTPDEARLELFKTLQLSTIFLPKNASNQNGTWSSSNIKVATVDSNGLVTSVSVGEVEITFRSADGDEDDSAEITVFSKSNNVSAGDDQNICEGENVELMASGGSSYLWSTGAKTSKISVSPSKTATYTVIAYDKNGDEIEEAQVKVTVNPIPIVDAGKNVTIQSGESTTLVAQGAVTYKWNIGDTGSKLTVSPKITTIYTVTGYNNGCEANDTVTVTVVDSSNLPVSAGAHRWLCAGSSTTLSATGGASYIWDNGEITSSITVSPAVTTYYTVKAFDADGKNIGSDIVAVKVSALPSVEVSNNITIKLGDKTTLNAHGTDKYRWSTGSTESSIVVSPKTTTTYSVTGRTNGCEDTKSVKVTVLKTSKVVADAGSDQDICSGSSTTLTAAGGFKYLWSTGETTEKIEVSPSSSTIYAVTAYDQQGENADTDQVKVNVTPFEPVEAGKNVTIQSGESTILSATGSNTYRWNTGKNGSSLTVSPKTTTTYTVTGNKNGCESKDTVTITVLDSPKLPVSAGRHRWICEGESTTLAATGGASYVWSTGETSASITVSPSETTYYEVRAYNNQGKSLGASTVAVKLNAMPSVEVSNDVTIDLGDKIVLKAQGTDKFRWSTGSYKSSITVSPTSTTIYSVTGRSNGCEDTKSVTVTVIDPHAMASRKSISSNPKGQINTEEKSMLNGDDTYVIGKEFQRNVTAGDYSLAKDNIEDIPFKLDIYPNPTSGEINISVSGMRNLSAINVFDFSGKLVHKENVTQNNKSIYKNTIRLSDYPSGIYLLQIIGNQQVITKKVVLK